MDSAQMREKFEEWLADGETAILVFENHDMSSSDCGLRIALPFWKSDAEKAVVGESKAPDTAMGLGWRYILEVKCETADEALKAMTESVKEGP